MRRNRNRQKTICKRRFRSLKNRAIISSKGWLIAGLPNSLWPKTNSKKRARIIRELKIPLRLTIQAFRASSYSAWANYRSSRPTGKPHSLVSKRHTITVRMRRISISWRVRSTSSASSICRWASFAKRMNASSPHKRIIRPWEIRPTKQAYCSLFPRHTAYLCAPTMRISRMSRPSKSIKNWAINSGLPMLLHRWLKSTFSNSSTTKRKSSRFAACPSSKIFTMPWAMPVANRYWRKSSWLIVNSTMP